MAVSISVSGVAIVGRMFVDEAGGEEVFRRSCAENLEWEKESQHDISHFFYVN